MASRASAPKARVALPLSLLVAGCAGLGPALRCPEEGGPAWRETSSEHFLVWTDLDRGEARALAGRLEWIRQAVVAAVWQSPLEPPAPMGVVALRSARELRQFTREDIPGWVIPDPNQPHLVLPAPDGEPRTSGIAREVALQLADTAWLRQPRWLRAGLAAYLETVTPLSGGATALVGGTPDWVHRTRRAGMEELFAWSGRDPPRRSADFAALNAGAWALTHFLVDERGRAFTAFQGRLGAGASPQRAWRESFPEYDPQAGGLARLERDLAAWADRGRPTRRAVPVRRPVAEPGDRPMRPAEIHALFAVLSLSVPAEKALPPELRRSRAVEESRRALEHDPAEPAALFVSIWLAPERERSARARAAARLAPHDWRIWLLVAAALERGEHAEKEAALRRAREIAPDQPAVLVALARELLAGGKAQEAVPVAAEAAERAAWKAFPLDLLSQAQASAGSCLEALATARRATEILPDWASQRDRAEMAERLGALEERCGSGADQRRPEQGSRTSSP